jgi:hypothetical protein
MGYLSEKKKKQGKLIDSAGEQVKNRARQQASFINDQVNTSGWNKKHILWLLSVMLLLVSGTGVVVYRQGVYAWQKPSGPVHQSIIAPHIEEEMKKDLYNKIKKKYDKAPGRGAPITDTLNNE